MPGAPGFNISKLNKNEEFLSEQEQGLYRTGIGIQIGSWNVIISCETLKTKYLQCCERIIQVHG